MISCFLEELDPVCEIFILSKLPISDSCVLEDIDPVYKSSKTYLTNLQDFSAPPVPTKFIAIPKVSGVPNIKFHKMILCFLIFLKYSGVSRKIFFLGGGVTDMSTNPKIMNMMFFRVFPKWNRNVTNPKWSRIIRAFGLLFSKNLQ